MQMYQLRVYWSIQIRNYSHSNAYSTSDVSKYFHKKISKVDLKIEELTTQNIIKMLEEGHLDAGIAATPLAIDHILELPIYYEPFVGYIPKVILFIP